MVMGYVHVFEQLQLLLVASIANRTQKCRNWNSTFPLNLHRDQILYARLKVQPSTMGRNELG